MFSTGGKAYVYLCYGIHHLFNIVANTKGIPEAVLVRAIEPLEGLTVMQERRNYRQNSKRLTTGPGNMSQALGITTALNGITLNGNLIWLEEHQQPDEQEIKSSPRIGVSYAGADARLPWRFYLKHSPFTSKL
ncbi:MAG: DNA-3-methyladenine glycosylase [Owenweeksia sp.]|nr:DNA-3-methyladenine glycosylase [Owenweeksia sp.]